MVVFSSSYQTMDKILTTSNVKHQAMKAYWGSGCIAPLILRPRR